MPVPILTATARPGTGTPALTDPTDPLRTKMPTPPRVPGPVPGRALAMWERQWLRAVPSAEIVYVVSNGVELMRGDDGGGGGAEEGLQAGCGGAIVGDDLKARRATGRLARRGGTCP